MNGWLVVGYFAISVTIGYFLFELIRLKFIQDDSFTGEDSELYIKKITMKMVRLIEYVKDNVEWR